MYKLKRTQKADNQLSNILYYVADSTGSVDVAMKLANTIENSILRLTEFPESGTIPKYSILARQNFRVLIVKKYLIFYKVDNDAQFVTIYSIYDSSQEYINLI